MQDFQDVQEGEAPLCLPILGVDMADEVAQLLDRQVPHEASEESCHLEGL